ncbi:hypothetical protein DRN87_05725 [Candidatus Geothermarchaeota archaeon]|nr:MAG: hypothetical protein DRN87_05725 [Candidatus Geothermarchaeota archaeon]HEW93991.1 ribbon-helix-helix protein, CopG family [Thermoprotei archaeon]
MKVVQTTVSEELHKRLLEIAKREGKSLKDVLREALEEWIIWRYGLEDDSFINSEPLDFGVDTDSSNIDEYIYSEES